MPLVGDTEVRCPCGSGCGVHLGPAVVTTGSRVTVVTGDGDVAQVPGGPGRLGRGSSVTARLWSECGRVGSWHLDFHKGSVYATYRWGKAQQEPDPVAPWPLLWRD